jgi:glucan phosphoethanolaminetransferase (alkaline phosphatase superfamily)
MEDQWGQSNLVLFLVYFNYWYHYSVNNKYFQKDKGNWRIIMDFAAFAIIFVGVLLVAVMFFGVIKLSEE